MAEQNYGEIICQAVDEIVRTRLEGISYDQTILCTIVDDSRRSEGIYTVTSNNRTRFDAVSNDTSYRKHHNVYVQIPGGDWNQQKIILARKTETADDPFIYKRPFDTFVDITGNLIKNSNYNYGLSANDPETVSIPLWSYNLEDSDAEIKGGGKTLPAYTRLGIQASFQSLLASFYDEATAMDYLVDQGDYGLKLTIVTETEATSKEDQKMAGYVLYLNCADMNGNPYDFQAFYLQEKVFDISTLGPIKAMKLEFYQTPGSFKASSGEEGILFPFLKDPFDGSMPINNLFINSDIVISLGYDTSDFTDEKVTAYTLNSTTYARTASPLSKNHKDIQLRWLHKLEDGSIISIDDTNDHDMDYEIRWYRYVLGSSAADEYSGVYWKKLLTQRRRKDTDKASTTLFLDDHWAYELYDENWINYNKEVAPTQRRKPEYFHSWLIPDITLDSEQIKAIIIYNDNPQRSNTVLCTNEDEVVNKATVDAVQALSISCDDESYGNYHVYSVGGALIDAAHAKTKRTWTPYFKLSQGGTDDAPPEVLIEAEQIEWIIPTVNTMIDLGMDAYPKPAAASEKVEFENGYYYYDDKDNNNLHIVRYGIGAASNELAGRNTQDYYIKSYWSQMYTNNTIVCKIIKNKITYTALHEMTFGTAGTTGADCTLVLDFEKNRTAILPGKTVKVRARLYDYENKEITTFQNDQYVRWSWRNPKSLQPTMTIENKEKFSCEISFNGTIGYCYNILEATLENWGRGDIVAYLPIPIATTEDAYISGTTTVLYSSSGEAMSYFQNPYVYYDKDGRKDGVTWKIRNRAISADSPYVPQLINDRLAPLSFYVKGACEDNCVVAEKNGGIIWSQPLLIEQNKYASTTLGNWDGELNVGEQEKGTILAPRIAAGKKNTDNTFSGVVLGDWKDDAGLQLTGMYGFNKGEQSFAFKEDGTAFLGKNGHGRIEFDGNKGLIQSQQYIQNKKGMMIDLDDGIIEMSKGKDDHHIKIDSTAVGGVTATDSADTAKKKCPFVIGENFRVDWDGSAWMTNGTFSGTLAAADGTFSGDLNAAGGTFKGNLSAAGGSFTGTLDVGEHFKVNENGEITATGGTIGGWKITTNALSAGGLTLYSDGRIVGAKIDNLLSSFELTSSGVKIYKGVIDTPKIDKGSITGSSITLGVQPNAETGQKGVNYFSAQLSEDGETAIVAIGGTVYAMAGEIGGWTISGGTLISDEDTAAIKTPNFSVDATGKIIAKDGEIGGWKITENGLEGSNIKLSNGSITAGGEDPNFSVSGDGTLKAKNAEIEGTFKAGDFSISADGSMKYSNNFSVSTDGIVTATSANITSAEFTSCAVTNSLKFNDKECSLQTIEITNYTTDIKSSTLNLTLDLSHPIQLEYDDIKPTISYPEGNTAHVSVSVPTYSLDYDEEGKPYLKNDWTTSGGTVYFPSLSISSVRVPKVDQYVPLKKSYKADIDIPVIADKAEKVSFTCITTNEAKTIPLPPPKKGSSSGAGGSGNTGGGGSSFVEQTMKD